MCSHCLGSSRMKSRLFLCHARPRRVAYLDSQAHSPAPGRPGSSLPPQCTYPHLPGMPLHLLSPCPHTLPGVQGTALCWSWHGTCHITLLWASVCTVLEWGQKVFFFFFLRSFFMKSFYLMTSHQDMQFQVPCCAFRFCLLDWKILKVGNLVSGPGK